MPVDIRKPARLLLPPILAVGVAMLISTSVNAIVRQADRIGPAVGDIIAFPAESTGRNAVPQLEVDRADGGKCVLELDALRKTGGSLVLEQRRPGLPRTYRAHWSGPRSTTTGQDCGTTADLNLHVDDVAALALSAGGYGPKAVKPIGQ